MLATKCPSILFQKPLTTNYNQKFHFVFCLNSKSEEHPLTFNVYDSGDLDGNQKCYDREPFGTAISTYKSFDFYEEQDFMISPPNFTKLNIQALPINGKAPPNTAFDLIVKANVNFELSFLASDEENFRVHDLTGFWTKDNSGGPPSQQNYMKNPKYLVHFHSNTYARIGVECVNDPSVKINATMFQSPFQFHENPNF
eukprot:CAMPEP_0114599392 /NCGR_PEP_ID=MMETSP0125-20121206/21928_1 /TAXON_ID=485358 ORGANISM="Aristerostoma sp., Strain ATCC 50986" /NCGR_SAMPLE_ID=MMETSP0125 /ASSEMBLY_ACC=CAM_ASM_000245 /LENGTH=197 /DNA_ID=CAMNT_0001806409 /DNA_START=1014 /DNA_END=1608 /DNA_ORIENTATION=+